MHDVHESGVRPVDASVGGLVVEERAGRVEAWGGGGERMLYFLVCLWHKFIAFLHSYL